MSAERRPFGGLGLRLLGPSSIAPIGRDDRPIKPRRRSAIRLISWRPGTRTKRLRRATSGSISASRTSSVSAPARASTRPDGSTIELPPMNRKPLSLPTRLTATQ